MNDPLFSKTGKEPEALFPDGRLPLVRDINSASSHGVLSKKFGVGYSYVANAANPNHPFIFNSKFLAALIRETGSLEFLKFLAAESGCGLYKIPDATCTGSLLPLSFYFEDSSDALGKAIRKIYQPPDADDDVFAGACDAADEALNALLGLREGLAQLRRKKAVDGKAES